MPNDAEHTVTMEYRQPQGTAQVGAGLREVRERLGWKLPDVAQGLRIRLPFLEAIERGDLAALPGPAYQTGFVRSYAQVLGLDPEEILRRFRAEGGLGAVAKAELSFLAPVPDRAVPRGAIVFLGVVMLLAGYAFWYRHTAHERRLSASVPSVPAELAPLAVPPKLVLPAPTPPAKAPEAIALRPAPALPKMTPPASQAAMAASASGAQATGPTQMAAGASQVITAIADTWVEVQDATGNILFSKTMHQGDTWPVPFEPGLSMTAGNAGGTSIAVNGKPGAALGAVGSVLRDYPLTAPAAAVTPANPSPAPKAVAPNTPAIAAAAAPAKPKN